MEVDYNALTAKIRRMDADIATTESTLRRMESESIGVDATGHLVRYPLPPSYYTFQRDLAAMKQERDVHAVEQEQMRRNARELMATLPTPRYTGVQRMIETEGTPVIGKPPPAPPPVAAPVPAPVAPARVGPAPVAPAPAVVGPAPVAPAPAAPATAPAPAPLAPDPTQIAQPPAALPPLPELPRRIGIPPEKPSILDRRLSDPPPGDPDKPLLDRPPP
jgi:hypothetical protein